MALTRYLFVDEPGNRDDDKYEPCMPRTWMSDDGQP